MAITVQVREIAETLSEELKEIDGIVEYALVAELPFLCTHLSEASSLLRMAISRFPAGEGEKMAKPLTVTIQRLREINASLKEKHKDIDDILASMRASSEVLDLYIDLSVASSLLRMAINALAAQLRELEN
jgi:hypothetical protein